MKFFLFIFASLILVSCSHSVYIVRHAEKSGSTNSTTMMMTNDPPLSEAGKVRAFVLKEELLHKHISHIYSTNTVRTKSTAEPLSQATKIRIELYNNIDSLVRVLKTLKGNALVVGHSNTVDDIVNKLCGKTRIAGDLRDEEYDNLFMVKLSGKRAKFSRKQYGYPSNP